MQKALDFFKSVDSHKFTNFGNPKSFISVHCCSLMMDMYMTITRKVSTSLLGTFAGFHGGLRRVLNPAK